MTVRVTRGQYDEITMLLAELDIIEKGGTPMRVTPARYDQIMALASNYDENAHSSAP